MFEREEDEYTRPEDAFRKHSSEVPGDSYAGWGKEPEEDEEPDPLDSQSMMAVHRNLMGHYQRELNVHYIPRMEMATDEAIYDHKQWDEADIAVLESRGQVPLVYNVTFTSVNWILGSQRQKPMDYSILPRRKEGLAQAERKTELMKYLSDVCHRPMHESRSFGEQVKAGLSWMETGVQDPEDGREIVFERHESWRNIIYDSAATEWDLSDGRYMFRPKWLDLDRAITMFPHRAEVIRQSVETTYESRHATSQSGDDAMDAQEMAINDFAGSSLYSEMSSRKRVRLIEVWYRVPEETEFLRGGDFTGEIFDKWSEGHVAEINEGRATIASKVKERVRVAIMCEQGLLIDTESPYRHNRFPFTPMWGYRDAETGFPYGMIRGVRSIQIDINKRASKALWHLSAQKTVISKNATDDHEAMREEVLRPDAYIVYNEGSQAPQTTTDLALANAQSDAMSRGISMIEQTSGVTNENMGRSSNATSGKAITARQDQGQLTTNTFFENLRFCRKIHGEKVLSNVEQFFTEKKNFRITNKRGNPEYVGINDDSIDGEENNFIGLTKADFIVSEEDYRATHRQAAVEQLVALVGVIGQANPMFAMQIADLVIEAMDIPKQDEIVKRIRQITGVADPDADPNNPDEETLALEKSKAAKAEFEQSMAMADKAEKEGKANKAQGEGMRAMAQAKLSEAEMDGLYLANIQSAIETSISLMGVPNAAATADQIMATAIQQRLNATKPQGGPPMADPNALPPGDPATQQQPQPQPQPNPEAAPDAMPPQPPMN
jgi:hypothetical protein